MLLADYGVTSISHGQFLINIKPKPDFSFKVLNNCSCFFSNYIAPVLLANAIPEASFVEAAEAGCASPKEDFPLEESVVEEQKSSPSEPANSPQPASTSWHDQEDDN